MNNKVSERLREMARKHPENAHHLQYLAWTNDRQALTIEEALEILDILEDAIIVCGDHGFYTTLIRKH